MKVMGPMNILCSKQSLRNHEQSPYSQTLLILPILAILVMLDMCVFKAKLEGRHFDHQIWILWQLRWNEPCQSHQYREYLMLQ